MKGALIFDLDGTLLNTIADLGSACNEALGACGFPTHRAEEYPHLVGNGINKLIERALPEGEKTPERIEQVRKVFVPYYNAHLCDQTHPYEGIEDVLHAAKQAGYRLGVASNKYEQATRYLIHHFFAGLFDAVHGERAGVERKPNPQIVKDLLHEMGIEPEQRIGANIRYIGDSGVDMQTAQQAGLPAVACAWGFCDKETLLAYQPAYCFDQPKDLLKLL